MAEGSEVQNFAMRGALGGKISPWQRGPQGPHFAMAEGPSGAKFRNGREALGGKISPWKRVPRGPNFAMTEGPTGQNFAPLKFLCKGLKWWDCHLSDRFAGSSSPGAPVCHLRDENHWLVGTTIWLIGEPLQLADGANHLVDWLRSVVWRLTSWGHLYTKPYEKANI